MTNGSFIVSEDGRAYSAANWAFRNTIDVIAEALSESDEGKRLAEWLRHDPSVQINHTVDVRELSPACREMFLKATEIAFQRQKPKGPTGWLEPEYWDGWIARFADLVKMIECIRHGISANEFNPHMKDTIPATGDRIGPGW